MNLSSIPYGYMECTCEQFPKVLFINDQMLRYLNLTEESPEWKNFYKENIFFMLPFEERELFRQQLQTAKDMDEPICVKHHIISISNISSEYVAWIKYMSHCSEEPYYAMVYTEATMDDLSDTPSIEHTYIHALESAYGVIFQINLLDGTVECIHGRETSGIGNLYDLRMTIESAREFWLNHYILEKDRPMMRDFFERITTKGEIERAQRPLQADFRISWEDNVIYQFIAVAIQKDPGTILLCLRDITQVKYSALQTNEIIAYHKLYDQLEDYVHIVNRAIGMMIFRLSGDVIYPSFISPELFENSDMIQEDHVRYIASGITKEEFLDRMPLLKENFEQLLNGTKLTIPAEQYYTDIENVGDNLILYCNKYGTGKDAFFELFLKKEKSSSGSDILENGIYVRTFGHFDVFKDGNPVLFSNEKEKELLAILIDRNGGTLTSKEAIGILWPDASMTEVIKGRYRKTALTLKRTLEKYGIGHILTSRKGTRNINVGTLTCDYYELLNKNEKYINSFNNSYMSEYSWAEETLASLWKYS